MNFIENLSQGSCKFSAINLCLEMALSTNSTDSDCCVALLWKCNVTGQTSQSKERNCVTELWIVTYQKDLQSTTADHKDMSASKVKYLEI